MPRRVTLIFGPKWTSVCQNLNLLLGLALVYRGIPPTMTFESQFFIKKKEKSKKKKLF